jgi:hypothetical protein
MAGQRGGILMVTITLTDGTDTLTWRPIAVSSVSLSRALLGSSVRALDGSLLSYVNGAKRESAISVEGTVDDSVSMEAWEADARSVTLTVTDHNDTEILDYSGVVSGLGLSYDNKQGTMQISFTIREA